MAIQIEVKGIHYSSEIITLGSVIKSYQSKSASYKRFHTIYKEIAKHEFGIDLPDEYGYAYPLEHNTRSFRKVYLVSAFNVIFGDFRYSVYAAMNNGLPKIQVNTITERRKYHDDYIAKCARFYFNPQDEKFKEMISDKFIVVEIKK